MQDLIQLFQRYNGFFKIIREINDIVEQLSSYGYSPFEIKCEIKIEKNDIS